MYPQSAVEEFQHVYAQYKLTVYHFMYRLTRNHHEASDLMQDTFLRFYQSGSSVQGKSIKSWLFQTSYRVFVDHYRKKQKRNCSPFDLAPEPACPETAHPEQCCIHNEWEEELHRQLERLKPRDRQILLLLAYEELSYREIAERLDCSESTIKTAIHRARLKMKRDSGYLAASV
ncbi:RNA polymerase sigma factor [Paenibacillus gansuensis]|uniref:RNA polymerase sigma factor n=1 Tax=Paenibacillus gansuensis TaxID=306542 RepID=A0ABW5PDB6_9BACL